MNDIDKVIDVLKQQEELFLLDAAEFFPFGTYMNKRGQIIPFSAYLENERPASSEVIDLLEKGLRNKIRNNNCLIAGIAIDAIVKENGEVYDAIEIRFYEPDMEVYERYFRYKIKEDRVEFWQYQIQFNCPLRRFKRLA